MPIKPYSEYRGKFGPITIICVGPKIFGLVRNLRHTNATSAAKVASLYQINTRMSWKDSEAKAHLRRLIETGAVTETMAPKDVFELSDLFLPYKKNFASNYRRLLKTIQSESHQNNNSDPPAWRDSDAKKELKKLLEDDVDGAWHRMDPTVLHQMSPLFSQYPKDRFVCNLKNLKASVAENKTAIAFDQAAYESDRSKFPVQIIGCRGYKRWDISDAKPALRLDVQNGNHTRCKPKELQKTREEYQDFPLKVFRKHIIQEEYAQKGRSYWMHKKEQKKKEKQNKKK